MKNNQPHIRVSGVPVEQRERVTIAALLIGLVTILIFAAFIPINDILLENTYIGGNHFPLGAFTVLLILVLVVNVILRKLAPALILSPAQMIAVWAIIAVPLGASSSGTMRQFVPNMVSFHYYASPENKWEELFSDKIPPSLLIHDEIAINNFFEGPPPGVSVPWQVWLEPALMWALYAFASYAVMIGLSVMLRKRWIEQERFTFPLVQVPIAVANSPAPGKLVNSFLRNKLVWIAVLLVVSVHGLRGWHRLNPGIPQIQLDMGWGFKELPFSLTNPYEIHIYPLMIGFFYLLSSEVCFSLWFFHLFARLEGITMGILGIPLARGAQGGYWLWASLQEAGGTLALAAWFIWLAKDHFRKVFRKGLTGDHSIDDSDEPLSYRVTVLLFLVGSTVMILWLVHFGSILPMAAISVLVTLSVFVTLAWLVSQGGVLFVMPSFSTTEIAVNLTGSSLWPTRTLLINLWNEKIFMNLREYMLPTLLNAYKMSDDTNLHRGSLLRSCILPIPLAFAVALVANIWLSFSHGGALAMPNIWAWYAKSPGHFSWVASLMVNPRHFSPRWIAHFAGGFGFVLATMWLRTHLSWFTLHPAGFIIAAGYPSIRIWFPAFVAWIVKAAVMRWGGYKAYQALRPFFLGLIVGDCVAAVMWIVIGFFTHSGYNLLPG